MRNPVSDPLLHCWSNRLVRHSLSPSLVWTMLVLFCAVMHLARSFKCLLIPCAVIRAVHLGLVDSLSLEDFILALRCFAARRGMPSTIYSDNGKTFTAAPSRLLRHVGSEGPSCNFITPRAPWWGSWWEVDKICP